MHRQRAVRCRPPADDPHRLAVHSRGQCLLLLGAVDGGIRRGVDDHVGASRVQQGFERARRRQVGGIDGYAVEALAVTARCVQVT
jgi:hypothetical protein